MDDATGWQPDPEREDQERYWNGSEWSDRVRPAGKARSLHLPEHVPELQRALAAATADIDAVEDRLSNLFDRTEGKTHSAPAPAAPVSPEPAPTTSEPDLDDDDIIDLLDEPDDVDEDDEDPIHEEFAGPTDRGDDDGDEDEDDDAAFAELDAALAAEEPEETEESGEPESKRRFFRRRS